MNQRNQPSNTIYDLFPNRFNPDFTDVNVSLEDHTLATLRQFIFDYFNELFHRNPLLKAQFQYRNSHSRSDIVTQNEITVNEWYEATRDSIAHNIITIRQSRSNSYLPTTAKGDELDFLKTLIDGAVYRLRFPEIVPPRTSTR